MSGRGFVLILLLVAGAGCSDKNSVPRDILPENKMEQVMWDMAQADQYAALYLAKDSAHIDRKAETMRLYAEVFRLHQVTPEEFRKSYRYYLDHPELNQVLFDSVIARGYRARSEAYERPSSPYHPPVKAGPAALGPGLPGEPSGAKVPNEGGRGTMPGRSSFPGAVGPAGQADIMRRMREAAGRRQDSIMRVMRGKRDTTKRRS
jgi:hypothetical protein